MNREALYHQLTLLAILVGIFSGVDTRCAAMQRTPQYLYSAESVKPGAETRRLVGSRRLRPFPD